MNNTYKDRRLNCLPLNGNDALERPEDKLRAVNRQLRFKCDSRRASRVVGAEGLVSCKARADAVGGTKFHVRIAELQRHRNVQQRQYWCLEVRTVAGKIWNSDRIGTPE